MNFSFNFFLKKKNKKNSIFLEKCEKPWIGGHEYGNCKIGRYSAAVLTQAKKVQK